MLGAKGRWLAFRLFCVNGGIIYYRKTRDFSLGSEDAEVSRDCQSVKVLTTFNKENIGMKGEQDCPSLFFWNMRSTKLILIIMHF